MIKYKEIAVIYFDAFNRGDLESVGNILSDDVSLQDWNISVMGKELVLREFLNIFKSFDALMLDVLQMYEIDNVVIAELTITFSKSESLKVVDILTFNKMNEICSISAYKGR